MKVFKLKSDDTVLGVVDSANTFQIERHGGRRNVMEIDEYGNKTRRVGGASEEVAIEDFEGELPSDISEHPYFLKDGKLTK